MPSLIQTDYIYLVKYEKAIFELFFIETDCERFPIHSYFYPITIHDFKFENIITIRLIKKELSLNSVALTNNT